MLLKTMRLELHGGWLGGTEKWVGESLDVSVGWLRRLFEIPRGTTTIWLSLYTRAGKDRYVGPAQMKRGNKTFNSYPIVRLPGAVFQALYLDSTLRPYVGKRLYIGVEYEEVPHAK